MKQIILLGALLAAMFTADITHSQSIPPDSTTYTATGQSGNLTHFRRPPDSLMIPGRLLILFRHRALDSGLLSSTYDYYYYPHIAHRKGEILPQGGPTYGSSGGPRGFPNDLRTQLFAERFYLDSGSNIVLNSSLRGFMLSNGGRWLHRFTTASPVDTLSVTRIGDTISCNHSDWMLLAMDSVHNPLVVAYLLTTLYRNDILFACPDYRLGKRLGRPGDTAADTKYLSCQKNTHMINAEGAWFYEVGDTSIIVGIADVGADYRHPDFGDSVLGQGHKFQIGWNFDVDSAGSAVYGATPGHGTAMAGIIGALTNNMLGAPLYDQSVAGVAGGWGTLMTHPMYPPRGRGVTLDIAAQDLQTNGYSAYVSSLFEMSAKSPNSPYGWGVHAINSSEGIGPGLFEISPVHAATNYAFENKVVLSAAMDESGVQGSNTSVIYPAGYEDPWVLAVGGSVPPTKEKIAQSCYGQTMDLIAPAGSAGPCGQNDLANYTTRCETPGAFFFGSYGGTSSACANASGAVALLLSHFHRLDTAAFQKMEPEDYQGILKASAWRGDSIRLANSAFLYAWQERSGWGHLDIGKAFQMLDSDRTQYPWSDYRIHHYSTSDTTKFTYGAWSDSAIFITMGPAESPQMTHFPDTLTHLDRRYQVGYLDGKGTHRIVTTTVTLPDIWDRTDSVPLFAWGRSGGPHAKSGWNLSTLFNFETGWTQVKNGTGWDADSLNEGIFHNGGTTFVLRTGQWRIRLNGSADTNPIIVPPDSELGFNFTVFGRTSGASGVAASRPINVSDFSVSVSGESAVRLEFLGERDGSVQIQFFDVLGRQIAAYPFRSIGGVNRTSFQLGHVASGTYVCRISGGRTSMSKSFKIVR